MDNLELMLDGQIEQPSWLPRAYTDMLCTYKSSTPSDPPIRVLIYHGDGDGSTILYRFYMEEYNTTLEQKQSYVDVDSIVNLGLLCETIDGGPHEEQTRATITKFCDSSGFDAFYLDVGRDVDKELLGHLTSFAVLYMVHAFYDSIPGAARADTRKVPSANGITRLPIQPYSKDFAEESKQGAAIIRSPARLRRIDDEKDGE